MSVCNKSIVKFNPIAAGGTISPAAFHFPQIQSEVFKAIDALNRHLLKGLLWLPLGSLE
jgi:hypothetical protein